MTDELLVAPRAEPIHLDEAKAHLRVPASSEDAFVARAVAAARVYVETWCRRVFVRQTRRLTLDCFPGVIEPQVGPLRAVQSIAYLDTAGALQTLDPARYQVDSRSDRARILPAYGESWPSTQAALNAVTVTYVAGTLAPVTAVDAGTDTLTVPGHGLAADAPVDLSNSGGALPAGLEPRTYYVRAPAADTLQLAETAGGGAVDITDAGTGQTFLGRLSPDLVNAMLLLVEDYYRHRGATSEAALHELPRGIEAMLAPHRLLRF